MMIRVCFLIQLLCFFSLLVSFTPCDARKSMRGLSVSHSKSKSGSMIERSKNLKIVSKFNLLRLISNVAPYVASPFGSMPPVSLPENSPPYCIYPPPPSTPFTTTPVTPIGGGGGGGTPDSPYIPPFLPLPGPPPSSTGGIVPSPPYTLPSPTSYIPSPSYSFPGPPSGSPDFGPSPPFYIPGPPGPTLSPPPYFEPSPPTLVPSPPTSYVPSPGGGGGGGSGFVPTPPVFEPPVVFPPPTVPPPPKRSSGLSLWCVAKPSVPDPIIEEAMNYACGSGADCNSIQPSGSCYQPDTLFAHASYAFNSYWQRTKVAGGTCEFGGTAMLVTVDPSYDGCHFLYY